MQIDAAAMNSSAIFRDPRQRRARFATAGQSRGLRNGMPVDRRKCRRSAPRQPSGNSVQAGRAGIGAKRCDPSEHFPHRRAGGARRYAAAPSAKWVKQA